MSTRHYSRPSVEYVGETGLANRALFQDTSATRPRVPISSKIVDGQLNYIVDALNELYDLGVVGTLPDESVTLAKIADMAEGSLISFNASDEAVLIAPSGTAGNVLTENASGAPSFQAPPGIPAGAIMPYGGNSAPTGYLLCDGAAINRTTYAGLFTAIGTTYGSGDGSTTFNVPDLRGRFALGKDDMGGSAASRVTSAVSGIDASVLGASGGSQLLHQHTHTATNTVTDPGHSHGLNNLHTTGGGPAYGGGTRNFIEVTSTSSATTGISVSTSIANAGTGTSQNMPPALTINYIIKT